MQEQKQQVIITPVVRTLKRKRPPSIEIPNVLKDICFDVSEKNLDNGVSFSRPGVGVFSLKGQKRFMEDSFKVVETCPDQIKGFFGVYDGHGGRKAADFVAENLHMNIFEMLKTCSGGETKEEAVEAGYLKTDKDFLKQGVTSGACCVTAFIEGDKLVISNLGDCRAVLCRDGNAEALTTDHRADNKDEQKIIESKGGYVEMHRGGWRVHGVLSVSRSIGDDHLKEWVVAEPDTKILHLSPDMEYLVLASDGLWEKVGNQEVADIVMESSQNRKKPGPINQDRDENDERFIMVNSSPVSKLHKTSSIGNQEPIKENQGENDGNYLLALPLEQKKRMGVSSIRRKIVRRKENENDFPSENEGPPMKTRRFSAQYQDQEIDSSGISSSSCVLVSACNELVNLAFSRGSLDDITVMVIDLKHFT